jgi:hypothetical protein
MLRVVCRHEAQIIDVLKHSASLGFGSHEGYAKESAVRHSPRRLCVHSPSQAFAKLAFTPESKGLVSIFFGQTVRRPLRHCTR